MILSFKKLEERRWERVHDILYKIFATIRKNSDAKHTQKHFFVKIIFFIVQM